MLRNRLPDPSCEYPNPTLGINLRDSLDDLQPGETAKLGNCYFDGDTRKRLGSMALTGNLGAFKGRGGIRVYPETATKFRMVAYSNKVSTISDGGVETVISQSVTSDQDVHFKTWSITDKTYFVNKSNPLCAISSAQVFATVTGVNVPASPTVTCQYLDRLFAIQGDGVWSTNPRVDTVWSPNSSSWAIYRPSGGSGVPTALHLHSLTGIFNNPQAQLLIFQPAAVTALTGTDFGSDVTLATPAATWNATLTLISPYLGTNSPYSVVSVPGMGTFWFTNDLNVAYLPYNSSSPLIIGDKIYSNRTDILGVNNVNVAALNQVRMIYHDRKLKLFLPVNSDTFATVQYWLDLRQMQTIPGLADTAKVSWSGPHTGQSLGAMWTENQSGDNEVLYACEGDSTVGMYVYTMNAANTFTDAVGGAANVINYDYRTPFSYFGATSYEKWMTDIRWDVIGQPENALVTVQDLHGSTISGMPIVDLDGAAFTSARYGNAVKYGTSITYGAGASQVIGHTPIESEQGSSIIGDAIQVKVTHTTGNFQVNRIVPQVRIRRQQPVS